MKKLSFLLIAVMVGASAQALLYDQNVTPDVIFGSGNGNGSFTVDRQNGVELGLRGKLRHGEDGLPHGEYNSNGDGTYTFNAGVAPFQSYPTSEWSFEFTVNTDYDDSSGYKLDDLTYVLEMTSTTGAIGGPYDVINGQNGDGIVLWDHSIGDNTTGNCAGVEAGSESEYLSLLANNNVLQQSWKPHWYVNSGFDPDAVGSYFYTLTAYDGQTQAQVASTGIEIIVVPEPATLALLGLGGLLLRKRK